MATSLHEGLCQYIVDNTQDAIIFADREGIIRLWNTGAETLFGYSAAEALGHSYGQNIETCLFAERYAPDGVSSNACFLSAQHLDSMAIGGETRQVNRDG